MATLRGSCLCGGVRFEVAQPFESVGACHCTSCKKISGGVGTASARVPVDAIRIVAGEELVRRYQPSEGLAKSFCSACGSNLFGGGWPERPKASVRLSAIDDDPQIRPQQRSFVAYNAPWFDIPDDGLPRYDERRPE